MCRCFFLSVVLIRAAVQNALQAPTSAPARCKLQATSHNPKTPSNRSVPKADKTILPSPYALLRLHTPPAEKE